MAIDTDSSKLFSPSLPWRQREIAYDAAFPHQARLIAVIVDGNTPELAESAASALAQRLAQDSTQFSGVERPDGGPFFARNGLLFLSTAEVQKTTEQIIAAQPLLGSLAADPSLRGVMDTLSNLADGVIHGGAKFTDVATPFRALSDTLQAVIAGKVQPLSWRNLIAGRPPKLREIRRTILVQPKLEFGALEPGAKASAAIRQAALDLGLTPDKGVRVRLTGSIPLADEEFGTLADGALRNALITIGAVALLLWLGLRSVRIIFCHSVHARLWACHDGRLWPDGGGTLQSDLGGFRRAVRGARGGSGHPVRRALSRRAPRPGRSARCARRCALPAPAWAVRSLLPPRRLPPVSTPSCRRIIAAYPSLG